MLAVEETYTDNVGLTPNATRRSDWITSVSPAISVNATGAQLKLRGSYSAQSLYYAQSGESQLNHQLSADASAEFVRQLLFLDARASIAQQNTSLQGAQALSNINTTGNRSTVNSFLISPYLKHSFGSNVNATARWTYSIVNSDAANAQRSNSNKIDLLVESGPAYRLYVWNVGYTREQIENGVQRDVTIEQLTAHTQRLITPQLYLLGTFGYDNSDYSTPDGSASSGAFWSTGVEWTPTPRTRLNATFGKRFYGPSYSLDFSHRARIAVFSATYTESITTSHAQQLLPSGVNTADYLNGLFLTRFPDATQRQQAVQQFILDNGLQSSLVVPVNFFTTQVFLVKRFQASAGIQGLQHTVMANVFSQKQTTQTAGQGVAGDFAQSSVINQTGTSLLWNWRITATDAANLTVGYTLNELPAMSREDTYTFAQLGFTHQFGQKLSGTLSLRRLSNSSSAANASYTENAVAARLQMRF